MFSAKLRQQIPGRIAATWDQVILGGVSIALLWFAIAQTNSYYPGASVFVVTGFGLATVTFTLARRDTGMALALFWLTAIAADAYAIFGW